MGEFVSFMAGKLSQEAGEVSRDGKDERDFGVVLYVLFVLSVPSAMSPQDGFIPAHGGYRKLRSYQKAQIVFDATVFFCGRFLDKRDRTVDQMVQAARSGKQNIVEASQASGTSKEMEIKLTNVARASLAEVEDYQDFLRTRRLLEWPPEHAYSRRLRALNRTPQPTYETFRKGIESPDPEIAANVVLGLIRATNYLLDRQLAALEQAFLAEGGLRERMTRARLRIRNQL
jgi:four helix bundle suffix protein